MPPTFTTKPVLRLGSETKKGPHRSATPMDDTMNITAATPLGQPQLSFIREGHVKFTPAQANSVIKWCRYERQRDETRAKSHIATLAEYMRRGQWLDKSQLDFARLNGQLILVNGHHRMRAQIDAGVDILWSIAIHDCDSDADVRALYYRFDTTLRKRSATNIVTGIGITEDLGLTKQFASSAWRAATIIAKDMRVRIAFDEAGKLPDEIAEVVHDYADEIKWVSDNYKAASSPIQQRLRTASVLCVEMVTLKYGGDSAQEFWRGLYNDDGLRKGDPRKTLLTDLTTRIGVAGLQASLMIASAKAWNAYNQGRDLKIIKVLNRPVAIDGTPFVVRP